MSILKYTARIENSNTNEIITIGSYESFETAIYKLSKIYQSYINTCNQELNITHIELSVIDNYKGYGVYREYIFTDYYSNSALVRKGYRKIVTPFMG